MKKFIIYLLILIPILTFISYLFNRSSADLSAQIRNYIYRAKEVGMVDNVSVFIQELKSKRRIGVEEDKAFFAGSLMKVPLLIIFLAQTQTDPALLQKKLLFTAQIEKSNVLQYPPVKNPLVIGQSYTVSDLLSRMIKESDNYPALMFDVYVPDIMRNLQTTMSGVGLVLQFQDNGVPFISPENYSKVFISLYDASFINKENSDRALEMLSDTDFKTALVAGVPPSVRVAHKFGIYDITNQNKVGLNDCGVVFLSENPYSICIMATGSQEHDLENTIKDISSITYENLK